LCRTKDVIELLEGILGEESTEVTAGTMNSVRTSKGKKNPLTNNAAMNRLNPAAKTLRAAERSPALLFLS